MSDSGSCRITIELISPFDTKDNNETQPNRYGITLSKNETEDFVTESGVNRHRYITMLNTYGYDEPDDSFTDIAMFYVVMDDTTKVSTTDLSTLLTDEVKTTLAANAVSATNSSYAEYVNIGGAWNGNSAGKNTVCYTYAVTDSNGSTANKNKATKTTKTTTLTNKNRVQFGLVYSDGSMYSKLVVFAAVKRKDEDAWVFSDNCLVFANGK